MHVVCMWGGRAPNYHHLRKNTNNNPQHEVPTEYLVALTVHLQNILRNKRCLLAYMQVRTCVRE